MKLARLLFCPVALALAQTPPAVHVPPAIQSLSDQSDFVFLGTVRQLHASSMPIVPASESTAIVRVDQILKGSDLVSDIQGKDITVQLAKAQSVKAGQRLIFFSKMGVVGKGMAVHEIAHFEQRKNRALAAQIAETVRRRPDIELQQRIAQADLVIVGKVASVHPVEQAKAQTSEHDPEWSEAEVDVEGVEKGAVQGRVTVLFPASRDIRWYESPKFMPGQEGIFILRVNRDPKLRVQGYTALDPLDFQPVNQLERVRSLKAR
jgi:hypothetical protein